jgi:DNA ligase (NAD+)
VIKRHGGKAASGVSSTTTVVVAGEKAAAPKLKKARDLGIPILDEAQFELLIQGVSLDQLRNSE